MKAQYSKDIPDAYIAREDDLKKIADLLTERIGPIEKVVVECSDDIQREFGSIKELLQFENPISKQIRRIQIRAHSADWEKQSTVTFRDSEWHGISIEIGARDDVVSRLRSDLLDVVAGMKLWYGFLHRRDWMLTSLSCGMILSIVALAGFALKHSALMTMRNEVPVAILYMSMFFTLTSPFWNWLRNQIFPKVMFVLGQGKDRHQQNERFQWGVVITFVLSILAGLILMAVQQLATST